MDGSSKRVEVAVNTLRYDGRGRRIVKDVRHSGDLDCTYHYYYDGDSLAETRNGSDQVIRQLVWGLMYIDELVQVMNNLEPAFDPQMQSLGSPAWALADANFNVIGLVDGSGVLLERYEYTPYGRRIVFSAFGPTYDPGRHAPLYISQRVTSIVTGDAQPWGRNDIGHQGLMHDEETGLVYNRARMLSPTLGRFMQRDPLNQNEPGGGYQDGMSLYQYVRSSPSNNNDSSGLVIDYIIRYGNFCGPGARGLVPIDAVDTCCQGHDNCYAACGVGGVGGLVMPNSCARDCDRTFCGCLRRANCGWGLNCNRYRCNAMTLFCSRGVSIW